MFYRLMKAILSPVLRVFYQPWIRGLEHVPASGPAILASNHLAVIDSFFLPLMLPREVVFLGKQDYFTGTGVKGRLVAAFMRGVGTIPVDRAGGKASEAALQTGLRRLREGGLFGIYPEGTRSPDGRLYRGKTGVARLALESGAPVIPVAMVGTNIAQPIGKRIPSLHRIGVVVGEPLDFSRYAGLESDRFVLRSITDEIMYELMRLSGQEYVDVYAATMKQRLAAAKKDGARRTGARVGAPGGRPVPDVSVPAPPPEDVDDSGGGGATERGTPPDGAAEDRVETLDGTTHDAPAPRRAGVPDAAGESDAADGPERDGAEEADDTAGGAGTMPAAAPEPRSADVAARPGGGRGRRERRRARQERRPRGQ